MTTKEGAVMKTEQVLIAGGGIAGPVVALALHKAGIRSTIYEAYPAPSDGVGAALMLAPNGLNALQAIGVDAALQAVSQPIPRMAVANGRGKVLNRFDGLPGMQPSRVMWRADLCRVLCEAVGTAGISIEYGKRLAAATETAGGVVAEFADGSRASGEVLIGADGIRSTVRKLIDDGAPGPQYVGFLGFGGEAPPGTVQAEPGTMTFVFGGGGFLGYWLDVDERVIWFASLPHDVPLSISAVHEVPASRWLDRLRELYGDDQPAQALLEHADPAGLMATGASEMLPPVPRWHRGRLVLVGDAAHAPSSSSGQGASLSIESAVQLARCLRDLPAPTEAFACYEQLRRERVEKVAANAARTNRQKASAPLAKALMHILMPIAVKVFFNPTRMFGELHDYRIEWSNPVRRATL
jgi:2-polyprenyl-6-methoxyphenol hydroxylase-like FAD-dependent oxidoreductase